MSELCTFRQLAPRVLELLPRALDTLAELSARLTRVTRILAGVSSIEKTLGENS